ncbi:MULTISPECIES: SoxR reducing system RseC family protein [unclassified Microbulbifer]|uniref:SoxR reducing system RseC family protein n=1 Tax=unclassified Microbulbifer TaxID=2619833 RepID=UPI0027E407F2|nr:MULTISPECIES: SoxR reducing system RseC family protein [unclassified Microbulbifer]
MIEERGRIVAVEADAVWVETIQRSGCHGCAAKPGCGTGLLEDYWARASRIRVTLNGRDPEHISLDDSAVIGIAERTLAGGALLVYLLPLISLLLAALAGERLAGETGAIAGAVLGLIAGAVLVRLYSRGHAADPAFAPQLLHIEPASRH